MFVLLKKLRSKPIACKAIGSHRSHPFCNTPHRHDSSKHKYNQTLLLPKTSFPMRPNHDQNREKFSYCLSHTHYLKQQSNSNEPQFILHDGPPYANGELHMGHALNRILKDVICRYKVMRGFKVHYKPGWDCHGLPIEIKAEKSIKLPDNVSMYSLRNERPELIRSEARKLAEKSIKLQKNALISWNVMADWENPYLTFSKEYVVNQLEVFKNMVKQNLIYRKHRPVYWSPSTQMALAEAEIEYNENHVSKAIFIKFSVKYPFKSKDLQNLLGPNLHLAVWTTTPWTLAANKAVAVNPEMTYCVASINTDDKTRLIVAESRLNDLKAKFDSLIVDPTVIPFKGSEIAEKLEYYNPITEETCPVLPADFVTNESGTGLVHMAPAHGFDDYLTGLKYSLDFSSHVDDFGRFTSDIKDESLAGLTVIDKGTDALIDKCQDLKILLSRESYVHKYPYDWRTKQPIIIKSTEQWFASIEELKLEAERRLQFVKFIPKESKSRLISQIKLRKEWCISRQRPWGVPIPCLINMNDGSYYLTPEYVSFVIQKMKDKGLEAWWTDDKDCQDWIPENLQSQKWQRSKETMDVWFDSGSSWSCISDIRTNKVDYVADVYLEGTDQHRGWFQSSLLLHIANTPNTNSIPFKNLITHGFVVDQSGSKMSKSLGNGLDPQELVYGSPNYQKYGPNVIRFWAASSLYTRDVSIGPEIIEKVAEHTKKIRFVLRYLLANVSNFDLTRDSVSFKDFQISDKIFAYELLKMRQGVLKFFDDYEFHTGLVELTKFVTIQLSSFYMEVAKDRLYADSFESISRRAACTMLFHSLHVILRLITPIVPELADEVWSHVPLTLRMSNAESIFYVNDDFYEQQLQNLVPTTETDELKLESSVLMSLRSHIFKSLQECRAKKQIASFLEANVYLQVHDNHNEMMPILEKYKSQLDDFFMVSNFKFGKNPLDEQSCDTFDLENENLKLTIYPTTNLKCQRCWKYNVETSESDLCTRCHHVLNIY